MSIEKLQPVSSTRRVPRCEICGTERIVKDAWACWNPEFGLWELESVLDQTYCQVCEKDVSLSWTKREQPPSQRIRELNDRFRKEGLGRGSIMLTYGIQERGSDFALNVIEAVRTFDAFSDDNDPWGEHDFGAVEVEGENVFFKIDYYDLALQQGSENPANEGFTHRVLTIMLSHEY